MYSRCIKDLFTKYDPFIITKHKVNIKILFTYIFMNSCHASQTWDGDRWINVFSAFCFLNDQSLHAPVIICIQHSTYVHFCMFIGFRILHCIFMPLYDSLRFCKCPPIKLVCELHTVVKIMQYNLSFWILHFLKLVYNFTLELDEFIHHIILVAIKKKNAVKRSIKSIKSIESVVVDVSVSQSNLVCFRRIELSFKLYLRDSFDLILYYTMKARLR